MNTEYATKTAKYLLTLCFLFLVAFVFQKIYVMYDWHIEEVADWWFQPQPSGYVSDSRTNNDEKISDAGSDANLYAKRQTSHLRLMFVGDMMFDRAIRQTANSKGYDYVFGQSAEIFNGYDVVIGNLEGSITNFPSHTVRADGTTGGTPLDFTFATATAPALQEAGIDIVSLANNHSYNRGQAGLDQTRENLKSTDIGFFGDPNNDPDNLSTIDCRNDICVGYIGYHEFVYQNEENVLTEIQNLRSKVDVIVIMPHWGIEYQKTPTTLQRNLAHQWIDAGADVIIGAHPHIIEAVEEYKGHKIFYSLGNYIFDQTFSFDTTHGLAIGLDIVKTENTDSMISYTLKPVENTKLSVSIPDQPTTDRVLGELEKISKPYLGVGTLFGSTTVSKYHQN